ncbi:MAG: lysylphosphatidylglycerol synthase transmembrane domain-containing protein [Bacteroidota bacterium]
MKSYSYLTKWIKLPLTLCAIIWVIYQIRTHESWMHLPAEGETLIHYPILAVLSMGLVAVNLSLEASKWKLSLAHLGINQPLRTAFRSVLVGLGLGLWMPGRIGEFPGRMHQLPASHWIRGGTLLSAGRLTQMLVSLSCFGLLWLAFFPQVAASGIPVYLPPLLVIAAWLGLLFIKKVHLGRKHTFLQKRKALSEIYLAFLDVPTSLWAKLLGVSLGRYLIFSLQYILLLISMGLPQHWLELTALISLIFGMRSFLPSLAFADIGVRESVAIAVAQWMDIPIFPVLVATLILFIINLVMPAFIGLICYWQVERKMEKNAKIRPSLG